MQLASTKYQNQTRTVSGTPIVYPDDVVLNCDTTTAPVVINLLTIPSGDWSTLWKLYVFDNNNNANVNNITINAPVGFKINNSASLVINTNGGGVVIRIGNDTNFIATLTNAGGNNLITVQKDSVTVGSRGRLNFLTGNGLTLTVTDNAGNNSIDEKVDIYDTGWLDLQGFAWLPVGTRPQYRILGKTMSFRGTVVIPIGDNGNTIIRPYVNEGSYSNSSLTNPYTGGGTGGVILGGAGGNESMQFNNGLTVLQSSSHNPDSTYLLPFVVGFRRVQTQNDATKAVAYSGIYTLGISATGILSLSTLFDLETYLNNTDTAPKSSSSSMLRFITSKVVAGNGVLNYTIIDGMAGTSAVVDTLQGVNGLPTHDMQANVNAPVTAGDYSNKHFVTLDASLASQIGGFNVPLSGAFSAFLN